MFPRAAMAALPAPFRNVKSVGGTGLQAEVRREKATSECSLSPDFLAPSQTKQNRSKRRPALRCHQVGTHNTFLRREEEII